MNLVESERNPVKKTAGIAAVLVFHLLLIWALVSGLATKVVDAVKPSVSATIIHTAPPPPPPKLAPPPPQKLAPPPPTYVPPPEVNVQQQSPPVIAAVTSKPAPVAPPPPTPQPAAPAPTPAPAPKPDVRTAAVIDANACTKPEYPAMSQRREEEGTVTLRFMIDVTGHVTNSEIVKSSGFSRLDDAARDALSKCLFKPGTLNGQPQPSTANLEYAWKLQ